MIPNLVLSLPQMKHGLTCSLTTKKPHAGVLLKDRFIEEFQIHYAL